MIQEAYLERLDALLAARDLEAVWFAQPNSFAWLTGGRNVVDRESPIGLAAAGYDGDAVTVITDSIEADRLRAEELPVGVTVSAFPWHDGSLADAIGDWSPRPAAADVDVPGLESVEATSLRQPLTAADVERYRELAFDAAAVLERVCRDCSSTATERAVAADLRGRLAARDIEAPVTLVGGDERALQYRHYTPTDAVLGGYALLSVTAVRDGLHASLTRTVAFDPPDSLAERHDSAMSVEVSALRATQDAAREDGGTAGDVFAAIEDAYDAVGYPREWEHHHQGGAAGYAGREWIATPESADPVTAPMAYAWNPTVRGAKSEDTALVGEDEIEVLTETGDWPTREVEPATGNGSLARHEILHR